MANISFDLLHNALDFLLSAAELSGKGDSRSLKYAVLHLDAAIELVLKARLVKEHWSLLFENADKANVGAMKSGEFVSAAMEPVIYRLAGAARVSLREKDRDNIKSLRGLRNKIQHFQVNVREDIVKSVLSFGCRFVLEFARKELQTDIAEQEDMVAKITSALLGFDEFVRQKMSLIEPRLAKQTTFYCPDCEQDACVVGCGKPPHCHFCEEDKDTREVAAQMDEGGEIRVCPACGQEALILRLLGSDDCETYCVFCGA